MKFFYHQRLSLLFTISQSTPPATPQFSSTAGTRVCHEDKLGNPSIYLSSERTLWPVSFFLLAALRALTTSRIYHHPRCRSEAAAYLIACYQDSAFSLNSFASILLHFESDVLLFRRSDSDAKILTATATKRWTDRKWMISCSQIQGEGDHVSG